MRTWYMNVCEACAAGESHAHDEKSCMGTVTLEVQESNIRAYAQAWLTDGDLPEVNEPERQVAMVLVGYDTVSHGELMSVSDSARAFAAEEFPEGL